MRQHPRIVLAASLALVSSMAYGCSREPDHLEALYRSARSVNAATAVGVNYAALGDLVRALATEVMIANDRAGNGPDKAVVTAFEKVLLDYKESLDAWKRKIDGAGAGTEDAMQAAWAKADKDTNTAVSLYLARH
jgi:hypothetical protein